MAKSTHSLNVLVVADCWCKVDGLCAKVKEELDGPDADVLVIAPALTGWLHSMFSDTDTEYAAAEARVADIVRRLDQHGVSARGEVADPDPAQAVDDAWSGFHADKILLVTETGDHENWRERDLRRRLGSYGVPVRHVTVEHDLAQSEGPRHVDSAGGDPLGAVTRRASLHWLTGPPRGTGRVGVESRAFTALPLAIAEQTPKPEQTTPSELLAAALSGYLGMQLALRVERDGHSVKEIVVNTDLHVSASPEYAVESVRFELRARVPALDEPTFLSVVEETLARTIKAIGLRSDVAVSIDARQDQDVGSTAAV